MLCLVISGLCRCLGQVPECTLLVSIVDSILRLSRGRPGFDSRRGELVLSAVERLIPKVSPDVTKRAPH